MGLKEDKLPDIFTLGRKRLLPADVIATFRSFAEKADYLLETEAFPFPIAKVRFVPEKRVGYVCAQLDQWAQEFEACANQFFINYQNVRDRMLEDYDKYREALQNFYPRISVVKKKFSFTYDIFTISLPKNLRVAQTTAAKLDAEQKARQLAEERMREKVTKQVDDFLADSVGVLREKTTELCKHVAAKIKKGELVTEGTIKSLRTWIDRFESMNFVGDGTVAQQLAHLRQTLGTRSAQEYRDDQTAAQALAGALNQIITVTKDLSDVGSVTGPTNAASSWTEEA